MHPTAPHFSPAAERNRAPILQVLQGLLPVRGRALEIASGSGQHAAFFAAALPGWQWHPTDVGDAAFASIAAWCQESGAANVAPAVVLDVAAKPWQSPATNAGPFDLVYCANLLHIAPWACCAGLMAGAAQHLTQRGVLVTYGPYLEADVPTAPSNVAFDTQLRASDPDWGVRALADVQAQAAKAGLLLQARHTMPANNLLLVWGRP